MPAATAAPHAALLRDAHVAKRWATAQARAALLSIELTASESDSGQAEYIATHHRWALTKRFGDLAEVEAWLDRVGGCAR